MFRPIPLINVSVFELIPCCFFVCLFGCLLCFHGCCFIYSSVIIQIEVWDDDIFSSPFIIQDSFSYPGFCVFSYKVEVFFNIVSKLIKMGNLFIALGKTVTKSFSVFHLVQQSLIKQSIRGLIINIIVWPMTQVYY